MRIPSYDDLTPSIPDISIRETFARDVVHSGAPYPPDIYSGAPYPRDVKDGSGMPSPLFACLRSARTPQTAVFIARDFSPRIARHGLACVVLDISGLGRLLGDAPAIGAELQRRAGGCGDLRIGIAPTQTAARLLAIACAGLTVATGDVAGAIAALPMAVLRQLASDDPPASVAVWKATLKRIETFHRWGLKTLGEVAALPASDLSARMGQDGVRLQDLARGLDSAPLVPDPDVPRFVESIELEWPIETLEPLSFVLARMIDPLSTALERADRGAVALRLDLRLVDRTVHRRVLQLPAAMRDAKVLRTLLLLDLESHPPLAGIDVVTLEIDPAPGRIVQYSLLERAMPSPETLATLNARLRALVGETRCGSPALLDTHRPDAFEMTRFHPESRVPPTAGRRRLEMPASSSNPLILRLFRPPIAVRVAVERGRPVHVPIDRRGMPGGRVEQQAGPWRTSGAWWDGTGTAWDRDEWDVALSDGAICRLFQDRATGRWFIEGVMD